MKRAKLKIYVTARDIREGQPHKPTCCPIALAAKRRLKNWRRDAGVEVSGMGFLRFVSKGRVHTYDLPMAAQRFIDRVDMGRRVRPFRFTATLAKRK